MRILINDGDAGIRLDRWLTEKSSLGLSRSKIQKIIKNGEAIVNKKTVTPHNILKSGDVVEINLSEKRSFAEKKHKGNTGVMSSPELDILNDAEDFLVVNKPAGLIVHESADEEKNNLVEVLLQKYPELKKVGEDPQRPAIVHRLDRDASGLMIIPKTQEMFDYLKKEFQARRVKKEYLALVYGKLSKDEDTINFPIDRSRDGYKMAAHPVLKKGGQNTDGKRAITEFEVLQRFVNFTLIKVKTKTGRTHQVRVHMSAYGHPLLGDDLYGTPKTKILNKKLNSGRIFLLAKKLTFTDLKGEIKEFEIEMPEDLNYLLTKIK
jgi:23S rRNA pseudouridine1911/1915/1917 synthase